MNRKLLTARNVIMLFILLTFVFSTINLAIRISSAPLYAPYADIAFRTRSDYVMLFVQSIIGMIAVGLPLFFGRKVPLHIPPINMVIYAIFLYCALYLGAVRNFYYRVPHWDTVLHGFSGVTLGILGFSIVHLLNKSKSVEFTLSPLFLSIFAFCFASTLGIFWEIFEFAVDYFLGANSQRWATETGIPLIGQAALADTMKDFIANTIGALVIAVVGYISLKHGKGWLDRFRIDTKN